MTIKCEFEGISEGYGTLARRVRGDLIQYKSGEMAIIEDRFSRYGCEATEIPRRTRVNPLTVRLVRYEVSM